MDPLEQKINRIIDTKLDSMTNMAVPNHFHNSWDSNQLNPADALNGWPVIQVSDATVAPTDTPTQGTFRWYVDTTPRYKLWAYLIYNNAGVQTPAWKVFQSGTGPTGITGVTGPTGATGSNGTTGPTGANASFHAVATVQVLTNGTASSYTDVDCSATVGANAVLLVLSGSMTSDSSTSTLTVRTNGSAIDYPGSNTASSQHGTNLLQSNSAGNAALGVLVVPTDTSGVIEYKTIGTNPVANLYILGYV